MHIIVITHSIYAISYINVLNDLCLCIKCLYTFPHLRNAIPYHIDNFYHLESDIKMKIYIY